MAKPSKNKKGIERKEYPKLFKLENGKKVLVNSIEEEAKYNPKIELKAASEEKKEEEKKNGWGA